MMAAVFASVVSNPVAFCTMIALYMLFMFNCMIAGRMDNQEKRHDTDRVMLMHKNVSEKAQDSLLWRAVATIKNTHKWFIIFTVSPYGNYTRQRRIAHLFTYIVTSMNVNAMFYT